MPREMPPPLPPPPPREPHSVPPPAVGSPRPRPPSRRGLWALLTVLAVACFLLVVAFDYYNPPPGSNCNDWWVYCPLGPSAATPLGTAFAFGNVTEFNLTAGAAAQPGCRVPDVGTEYCQIVGMNGTSSGLTITSIRLQLDENGGGIVPYVSVTLLDSEGRGIAQSFAMGDWVSCTPAACGVATSSNSLSAVLTTSMKLVLDGGSSAAFPDGLAGYGFTAVGSGSFSGTVGPLTLK